MLQNEPIENSIINIAFCVLKRNKQALKQVISVLQFQEDHHSEIRRRFEEEKARLENKVK
jgi:hypothetical protein